MTPTSTFLPMLAVAAEPFDSPEHLFEVKWDGVRALTAVECSGWRLWGRQVADYQPRYPELDVLRRFPAGTVVDGELVVLRQGRADLPALLSRHQLVHPRKIRYASRQAPASYLIFDLLCWRGEPLFDRPLSERRKRLEELLNRYGQSPLVLSEGIVGPGKEFFGQAVAQGHEGVMAKHLASRYLPGQRGSAWRKIKPRRSIPCVIIGYTQGRQGVASLLVAAPRDGVLEYVAELTSGLSDRERVDLGQRLSKCIRAQPVVPCPKKARWVEPGILCRVEYLQWTSRGRLRDASFRGLIEPAGLPLPNAKYARCRDSLERS